MNFPTIGDAVAKGWVQRANGKTIPKVAVGVIKQRICAEPKIFTDNIHVPRGASAEQVVEGGIGS